MLTFSYAFVLNDVFLSVDFFLFFLSPLFDQEGQQQQERRENERTAEKKMAWREKKGARRGEEEEEEEAEYIFLFLSVTHEQMYTGLLSFIHIDINSFLFFSLLSSNRQRKE
jgi:hypothetical protein